MYVCNICMYVYVCMYVCSMYMYVCMYVICMYVCNMYVCMYVCNMYVCMYVCMYGVFGLFGTCTGYVLRRGGV